jgi:hypothetical protein
MAITLNMGRTVQMDSSSQGIDPDDPLSQSFYRAGIIKSAVTVAYGTGRVYTHPCPKQINLFNAAAGKLASPPATPGRWLYRQCKYRALRCSAGCLLDKHNAYWEKVFDTFLQRLSTAATELYADISALCLPGRMKYILKILPLVSEKPSGSCLAVIIPFRSSLFRRGTARNPGYPGLAGRTCFTGNDLDKIICCCRKISQADFQVSCGSIAPASGGNSRLELLSPGIRSNKKTFLFFTGVIQVYN